MVRYTHIIHHAIIFYPCIHLNNCYSSQSEYRGTKCGGTNCLNTLSSDDLYIKFANHKLCLKQVFPSDYF